MDEVDSPYMRRKKHKQQKADPHLSELQRKLQERRKEGLTYGLTSDESDLIDDDDDGGDSEEDVLAQYRMDPSKQRQSNRPSSAKRRTPTYQDTSEMSLGDTIRPGQGGNRFMKQRGSGMTETMPSLSSGGKGRTSPGMPALTSPKLSPKDSKSLTDALGGKRTPSPKVQTQSLSQEDIIFGRKTPTNDPRRQSPVDNKSWQPPSFRKSPVTEQLDNRAASPGPGLQGRRTPSQEPMLQSIHENDKSPRKDRFPSPKDRTSRDRLTSPKDRLPSPKDHLPSPKDRLPSPKDRFSSDRRSPSRNLSIEDSPRSELPKPKPRHKTDIFGKTDHVDVDLETDSPSAAAASRFRHSAQGGRKTPTQFQQNGRKTPTNIDGRKTPTERKSPGLSFRKSDTRQEASKRDPSPKREIKKQASLLDFLNEDVDDKKKKKEDTKPKLLLREQPEEAPEMESSVREDILGDKINQAHRRRNQSYIPESVPSGKDSQKSSKVSDKDKAIPDDSSLCEEFEKDPLGRSFAEKKATTKPGKGVTDSRKADDVISKVAQEQDRPSTMKSDTNASLKKNDKVHRPKPRHSLPGTPSTQATLSEMSFNDTMSIRQAVYEEWRRERLQSARKEKKEKLKQEEEKKKKEEEEKKEKKLENESSYRTWKESKEETFVKKKREEKKKEQEKKEAEEREKIEKKKEAEKNYKIWKEEKDIKVQEEQRKKRNIERQKEREKEDLKKQKERENETALRGWTNQKEKVLKQKAKEDKQKMKQTQKEEHALKKEQEKEAEKLYEQWLRKKDEVKCKERNRKYGSTEEIEFRPAWSPASKTIPFGR